MSKTTIIIADDHAIVRTGISALLKYQKDLKVVGEAEDGEEAVRLAKELKPDVVIMDLVMPRMGGVEATQAIREAHLSSKVLILTTFGTSVDVAHAVEAGAAGAIMKDVPNERLVEAIRAVAHGEKVFSGGVEQTLAEEQSAPLLTPRQLGILQSITRGLTNAEIAAQFGISLDGVKQHCIKIFKRLGAANRAEAVSIAMHRKLLRP